jgi:hypothetical protein
MPEQHLFEYAIIRVVPRVEREEFLNVGVIVYCKGMKFLQTIFTLDEARLHALFAGADDALIREHLHAFEKISAGDASGGAIACLDMPSRFRWLTAKRSTILQSSLVHPGLTQDPVITLKKLHEQLVQ